MQITITAKTVEEAVRLGAEQLGTTPDRVTYTVLDEPKKGLFGLGATDARVEVAFDADADVNDPVVDTTPDENIDPNYTVTPEVPELADDSAEMLALSFVVTLIANMGADAEAGIESIDDQPSDKDPELIERTIRIGVYGESGGLLIGRHGDVLDAIQYLANLAAARAPKVRGVRYRVIVDVENYRAKREETLRALARRTASKALSYGRNMTLEPMSPYERRIIHSEVQGIEGVHTYSVGNDLDRRVVIALGDGEQE